MAKLILSDLASFNPSGVNTLTSNHSAIEEAIEKTLSRDGTSPNSMLADFDMNSNQILNLPAATTNTEPVRLLEFNTAISELETLIGAVTGTTTLAFSSISGTLLAAQMPALTGDLTTSAGSVVSTLATVNSNVGSFGSSTQIPTVTVNAKGLVTAASNTAFPAITGDITTVAGAHVSTLATVNSNVGSFGSGTSIPTVTVNAKGLVTAASGNAVVAPAGTLSGATLAAGVLASSLTSVGVLTGLQIAASGYMNFGVTAGTGGYGIRDNGGTLQVKNSGGSWDVIPTTGFSQWTTTGSDIYFTTGSTGIGTTTPRNLEVATSDTNTSFAAAAAQFQVNIRNSSATSNNWSSLSFLPATGYTPTASIAVQNTTHASNLGNMVFYNDGNTERLRIATGGNVISTGNVGVGGTPNPIADSSSGRVLTVANTASTKRALLELWGNVAPSSNNVTGQISFLNGVSPSGPAAAILSASTGTTSGTGNLSFWTSASAGSLIQQMTLTTGGVLGIGTATPNANDTTSRLTVGGTDAVFVTSCIENFGTGSSGLVVRRTGGTAAAWAVYAPLDSTDLRLYAGSAGGIGDSVYFKNDGKVGIGKSIPTEVLHVAGSILTEADLKVKTGTITNRIRFTDTESIYAGLAGSVLRLDLGLNTGSSLLEFSTNKDYADTTLSNLPNGLIGYGSDTYLTSVIDQCYWISQNRLRNDTTYSGGGPGGIYYDIDGIGNIQGIAVTGMTGYTPGSTVRYTIGAGVGGTASSAVPHGTALVNGTGNGITTFYHPNGSALNSGNKITGPWTQSAHFRMDPPPVGGPRLKVDFGPGIAFVRDIKPYCLDSGSAFATFTYGNDVAINGGLTTPSGIYMVCRVTSGAPNNIQQRFEFGVTDLVGTTLQDSFYIGRGVYGYGMSDPGQGVLSFAVSSFITSNITTMNCTTATASTLTCQGSTNGLVLADRNQNGSVDILYRNGGALYFYANSANRLIMDDGGNFAPAVDNVSQCGVANLRWQHIWSADGVVSSSDETLKTDLQPLPEALKIIRSVEPKRYKWKSGGKEEITVHEEQDVSEEYDSPVLDTDGKEVYDILQHGMDENLHPDTGQTAFIEKKEITELRTEKKTRTVRKVMPVQKFIDRPGKRTHWGFLAKDLLEATKEHGDFAGYVRDENGKEHLRYQQLIPILWKAVQELSEEIVKLKKDKK